LKDLLVDFQIGEIGILIGSMILLSFLPLMGIYKSITKLIRYFIAVTAAILFAFGAYANIAHRQIEVFDINLAEYKMGQTTVQVQYPTWLTEDDILNCNDNNKVSLLVADGTLAPIQLDEPVPGISAWNDRCDPTIARTNAPLTQGETFVFHLILINRDALRGEKFTITPKIIDPTKGKVELIDDVMNIYLEHPVWNFIRHWYLISLPLILAALASDVWKAMRPEK
jgi:hypothetical protein